MEGKTVILSVLILSLVLAQVQVEAKSCCPSTTARNTYNVCRITGSSQTTCAKLSGCIIQTSSTCESPYDYVTLENSGDHTVNAYCKLGCASSVCNAIATLQTSGEVVNEAVEQCTKACNEFCTKGALEIE